MSDSSPASGSPRALRLSESVTGILDRVRRRRLFFTLAEFPILLAAAIAVAWLLQAVADRVFHLPWSARCVLLALQIAGALVWFERLVVRPWRRRLDRKGAALLVERCIPEFRGSLISAVELTSPGAAAPPPSLPLVGRLIADVEERIGSIEVVRRVVRPDRLKKLLVRAAVPVVSALLLFVLCQPTSGLLLQRILLANAEFPPATRVLPVTENLTVDEGEGTVLAARATGEIPVEGKVVVTYPGRPPETIAVARADHSSDTFSLPMANLREGFSYRFLLNDGIGPEHRVTVRSRPVAEGLRFRLSPPAYTCLPESELLPTALKLLEGSTLRIEGRSNRPLRAGELRIGGAGSVMPLTVEPENRLGFLIDVPVPGEGWKSLSVHLSSTEGVESVNEPVYPVELVRDRAPAVTLHAPKDEFSTVIADDSVPIAFEASDDFGIASAKLHYRVFRLMPDGSTEGVGDGEVPFAAPTGETMWPHRFSWNLALLAPQVSTGYSIAFWIEVTDNHADSPATGRSTERTLKVVSEQEKRMELLELLGQKAAEIERLYEQQRAVNGRLEESHR